MHAVIAEYLRRGQKDELLAYLKEYERELDIRTPENICSNTAVNNILSAYTRRARRECLVQICFFIIAECY